MRKKLIATLIAFLAIVPAFAVLNEKDLAQTLAVLRQELQMAKAEMQKSQVFISANTKATHERLVSLIQKTNELSLMLYSQKQDYTFDLTYALDEVTKEYKAFSNVRVPFDAIVTQMEIEIERYEKLIATLVSLPPALAPEEEIHDHHADEEALPDSLRAIRDSIEAEHALIHARLEFGKDDALEHSPFTLDAKGCEDRDSCLFYARSLLEMYSQFKDQIIDDNYHYSRVNSMLQEAYDYAQERYRQVQHNIFIDGQTPYWRILRRFSFFFRRAKLDAREKYSRDFFDTVQSEWRGPMVIGLGFFVLFYLIIAVLLGSMLTRLLMRFVPYFGTEEFKEHKLCLLLLIAVVIFALTVTVGATISQHNFFTMAAWLLVEYAWLLAAIFGSLLIRLHGREINATLAAYTPIMLMGLLVISFRIIFIPNNLTNLLFPPILLCFTLWQLYGTLHFRSELPKDDRLYMWFTLAVLAGTTVTALCGYVLLAIQIVIWWIFQVAIIQTITTLFYLLKKVYDKRLAPQVKKYKKNHPNEVLDNDGAFIEITWWYDFVRMVFLPVLTVWSIPTCIFMAANVFDLAEICVKYFSHLFLNNENVIQLSLLKLAVILSLYFLFRYLIYLFRSLFRIRRIRKAEREAGEYKIQASQVNLTLGNNLIAIALWGFYLIIVLNYLQIPTSALKLVSAGLATGIGFAMKDVLNNFFYGVQLMSGRLRVGDYVECDGVRGKVESINYQSTQLTALDGSVMAFPNSNLFNKNFKNLTKNHSYELLTIPVGIKYGSDIEQVRQLLIKQLWTLQSTDEYGRPLIDPAFGFEVRFDGFGDSSVNLNVMQFVLVERKGPYAAKAKEVIYNALNAGGIEIPFPQRDVYIKQAP